MSTHVRSSIYNQMSMKIGELFQNRIPIFNFKSEGKNRHLLKQLGKTMRFWYLLHLLQVKALTSMGICAGFQESLLPLYAKNRK